MTHDATSAAESFRLEVWAQEGTPPAGDLTSPTCSSANGCEFRTNEFGGRLPVHTAAEAAEQAGTEVPWCIRPWVAFGGVVAVVGKPKVGKTDLVMAACAAVLDGVPFLGEQVSRTKVLYVTEQGPGTIRPYLDRWGLSVREDFFLVYLFEVRGLTWEALAAGVVSEARARGARLIVIDTFAAVAGLQGDEENSSGAILAAARPIQQAAAEHALAVALLVHERKSGGSVADAGRGSGALAGAVDCLMLLRRPEGNVSATIRQIESAARYEATPATLAIDRSEAGYVPIGDSAAVAVKAARSALLRVLPTSKGRKNDPYVYWINSSGTQAPKRTNESEAGP